MTRPSQRIRQTFAEYPRQFWVLTGATFVDASGGWLLFPFFSLYVTNRFNAGLTEVGIVFGLFAVAALVGSTIGGALSDRRGRKIMIIFGLVTSAMASLTMIVVTDLNLFYAVAFFVGLFSSAGQPAQQAMVADMLPEEQRADGYGILRVSMNVAAAFGPALGGFIATRSFAYLFVGDAVTSIVTAVIIGLVITETKPERAAGTPPESITSTFRGYAVPLRDTVFVLFMLAAILSTLVYMQLSSTLPVYLRDQHGLAPANYGFLLSLNAGMVILFQFPITRRLRGSAPLLMMALGTLLYAVGFGLFGVVSLLGGFVVAVIILTVGEMITVPVAQAIVAGLAPEEMRGRYMALFGYAWTLPTVFGPLLAGLVMDNINPDLVWYGAFVLCGLSAGIYLLLERRIGSAIRPVPEAGRG